MATSQIHTLISELYDNSFDNVDADIRSTEIRAAEQQIQQGLGMRPTLSLLRIIDLYEEKLRSFLSECIEVAKSCDTNPFELDIESFFEWLNNTVKPLHHIFEEKLRTINDGRSVTRISRKYADLNDLQTSIFRDFKYQFKKEFELIKKEYKARNMNNNYYIMNSDNARININSTDHSTNIANSKELFSELRSCLQGQSEIPSERLADIMSAIDQLESSITENKSNSLKTYQKFIALIADHMSIVTPFIPALTQLIGS